MRWILLFLILAMAGSLRAERVMMYQNRFSDKLASYSLLVNGERPINEFGNPGPVPGGARSFWVGQFTVGERVVDDVDDPHFGDNIEEAWLEPLIWSVEDFSVDWEDAEIRFESGGQSLRVSVERAGEVVLGDWHDLPELGVDHRSEPAGARVPELTFIGSDDWREATWLVSNPHVVGSGAPDLLFDDVVGGESMTVQLERWRLAPATVGGGGVLARFTPNRPDFPIPEPSGVVLLGLSALLLLPMIAGKRWNSR